MHLEMERRGTRSDAEWQAVVSELQALKRKLHSKSEALIIISKDLDSTRREKDQFKLMAEKLRVRCQAYKRQFTDFPLTKDQASLIQMLRDMKNQKIAHQKQSEVLQQKLNEALGDVKLLREKFARQRIGDEGVGPRHFPAHEREELVTELEDAKLQAEHYRQEFNIASDQLTELMTEKDDLAQKSERLNNELNFMLNGDKKRIIDIDALCMENKYLQERVKQCQEEKNSLHAQISKLKALLNSRKAPSSDIKPGKIRNSGLVISPKQVKEILINRAGLPTSSETVSDLQSIAAALLETINDKNLALHHLRNTNKILGKRVAELELKLKTLEVAGLWNFSGQSRPQPSSTPKITIEQFDLRPTIENEDQFFSSLGSRLSKLTDVCDKSFKESKLVSLTPESSSSASDVAALGEDDIVTSSGVGATHSGIGSTIGDSSASDGASLGEDVIVTSNGINAACRGIGSKIHGSTYIKHDSSNSDEGANAVNSDFKDSKGDIDDVAPDEGDIDTSRGISTANSGISLPNGGSNPIKNDSSDTDYGDYVEDHAHVAALDNDGIVPTSGIGAENGGTDHDRCASDGDVKSSEGDPDVTEYGIHASNDGIEYEKGGTNAVKNDNDSSNNHADASASITAQSNTDATHAMSEGISVSTCGTSASSNINFTIGDISNAAAFKGKEEEGPDGHGDISVEKNEASMTSGLPHIDPAL